MDKEVSGTREKTKLCRALEVNVLPDFMAVAGERNVIAFVLRERSRDVFPMTKQSKQTGACMKSSIE